MIAIPVNQIKRNVIRRKSVGNTINRTLQAHRRAILILPTTVITDANDVKKKSHRKKDPIKLCARLTAKLLRTAYKLKIIRFKMDEDPLQRRIYFLTFVESLEIIFSQYKETYEVLLDYTKIGGGNIKEFSKKRILGIFCMPILMCIPED